MKKAKKYQLKKAQAGTKNKPFVQSNTYATTGEEATRLDNPETQQSPESNPAYQQQTPNKNPLGDFFSVFNPLAQITTGVANTVTDYKNRKQELQQYLDAMQTRGYENFNEDGLNKAPLYVKTGGKVTQYYQTGGYTKAEILKYLNSLQGYSVGSMQTGGSAVGAAAGPQYNFPAPFYGNANDSALYNNTYLNSSQYNIPLLEDYMNKNNAINNKQGTKNYAIMLAAYKDALGKKSFKSGGLNSDEINAVLASGRVNGHPVTARQRKLFELVDKGHTVPEARSIINGESPEAKTGWIAEAVNPAHKGYCTPETKSTCTPARRALAERFKHGDLHKAEFGYGQFGQDSYGYNNSDLATLMMMPYGGGPLTPEGAAQILHDGTTHGKPISDQQRKFFGWKSHQSAKNGIKINPAHKGEFTAKAKAAGMSVQEFASHVMGNKTNYDSGTVEQANFARNATKFKHQTGGKTQPILAEAGEVYSTPNDTLKKIPDSADRHEAASGGVPVNDADRVLENTSTYRNDADSKELKLSPEEASALTGVKFDKSVSHSQALEDADKHYQKFRFKISKAMEKNIDTLQDDRLDKYASNSLNLNQLHLSTIPTSGQVFDNLFHHQEITKQIAGIDQARAACGGKYGIQEAQMGAYNTGRAAYNPTFGSMVGDQGNPMGADVVGGAGYPLGAGAVGQAGVPIDYQGLHLRPPGIGNNQQGYDPKDWYFDASTGKWIVNATVYGNRGNGSRLPLPTSPNNPFPQVGNQSFNPEIGAPDFKTVLNNGETTQGSRQFNFKKQPQSDFNEPLNWYDVAGPIGNYLSATDRIPAQYNPVQLNQIRMRLQNPEPALQAGTADYNAALRTVKNMPGSQSNISNLFTNKYNIDNSILGNAENVNSQIKNSETQYNAGIRDRQSELDQQSRARFQQEFLGSLEAQRQQKSQSLNELYDRFAQNAKLNREGKLLSKLFPAYDQEGNFSGYQTMMSNPNAIPSFLANQPTTKQAPSKYNNPTYNEEQMWRYIQSKLLFGKRGI